MKSFTKNDALAMKSFLIGAGSVSLLAGITLSMSIWRDRGSSAMDPARNGSASTGGVVPTERALPMTSQASPVRSLPPAQAVAQVPGIFPTQIKGTQPAPQKIVQPSPSQTRVNTAGAQHSQGKHTFQPPSLSSVSTSSQGQVLNTTGPQISGQAALPTQNLSVTEPTLELSPGVAEPAAFYADDAGGTPAQAEAVNAISENLMKNMDQAATVESDEVLAATWDAEKESADSNYRNIFGVAQYLQHSTEAAAAAVNGGQ